MRRNILGGMGLMQEQISRYNHDELGANGWEISAHGGSAPDHEPIQGRQYSDKDYQQLNSSLARRIGTLNCGHTASPVIIGTSEPQYTEQHLQELAQQNAEGVAYQGRQYTLYEASQKQRQIERIMRKQKNRILTAEASGDKDYLQISRIRLGRLGEEYKQFSQATGLRTQRERLEVTGFGRGQAGRTTQAVNYKAIVGSKTAIGIEVGRVSTHFEQRTYERKIVAKDIRGALTSPLKVGNIKTREDGRKSVELIGEFARVQINPDDGTLITAWKTSSKLRNKLKGGQP